LGELTPQFKWMAIAAYSLTLICLVVAALVANLETPNKPHLASLYDIAAHGFTMGLGFFFGGMYGPGARRK
jgi:hypothetical protein